MPVKSKKINIAITVDAQHKGSTRAEPRKYQ
jgi:hypothetical protein